MTPELEQLLSDIREHLICDCNNGWNDFTNRFVTNGDRTWEEQMKTGDSSAWELIQRIDKLHG